MALKKLQAQHYPGLESGDETDKVRYMVTGLHGQSLHEIRLMLPEKRFTLRTSLHVAQQSLIGLEEIHKACYVHRDLKSESTVTGLIAKDVQRIYIVNCELCRKYINERKNLRPFRDKTSFRGSQRYSSIDAFVEKDQGRVYDMWSWFQSIIEMTAGKLPFEDENGPSTFKEFLPWIAERKETAFKNPEIMLAECSKEYRKVYDHLRTLTLIQQPDYSLIVGALTESVQKNNCDNKLPVD